MEILQIRFLASIFIDAADITPHTSVYTKLSEIFGDDIILGTMQELTPQGMKSRIRFDVPSQGIIVSIATNRLNIEKVPKVISPNALGSFEDFCTLSVAYFSQFTDKFIKKSNRLAFVNHNIITNFECNVLDNFSDKLFLLPRIYSENKPSEWSCRFVSKQSKTINGNEEDINIASKIGRIQGQMSINSEVKEFEGLEIEIDINTKAENTDNRFKKDDIESFFNNAPSIVDEISESINTHLGI